MNFSMLHPADQLVMIMDRLYKYGMTTTSGGNLSIRDSEGCVWITPSGIDKGSLRREDIMCIKPDGSVVGIHKPSVEYHFHCGIYEKRSDINAVLHAHPPALVAFSVIRKAPNTAIIPNAKFMCGEIAMVDYACPGSKKLEESIVESFEKGHNTAILNNHGAVVGSYDLFHAFMAFETLEFCARLEINARSMGSLPIGLSQKHMDIYKHKINPVMEEYEHTSYTSEELDIRREMCKLIHRAYDNRLFTSAQGTFSHRLSDGSFIITPYDVDRKYIEPQDLVRIENDKTEKGKRPSRSVFLHKEIYKNSPDVNSVIIAHPPYIMAFAITDMPFDARILPESYIMLRDVEKFPFGCAFMQPALLSKEINLKHPSVLIENDCVIVAGTNLLNAFDRLEVIEYSAKSLVETYQLNSEVQKITEEELNEIRTVYNL